MKRQLYTDSRKFETDTRYDECLYAAPRPSTHSPEIHRPGKDLCIHTDNEHKITYYLHLWEISRTTKTRSYRSLRPLQSISCEVRP